MKHLLEVVRAGSLTTVQDAGRRGMAHLAIPRSGAADAASYRLANRLVGNSETAATLETTLDGVAVRTTADCTIAVTGARCPITVTGAHSAVAAHRSPAGWGVPVMVRAGQIIDVGIASQGLRSYLAISGGIVVDPVLGSRSTDLLSGLGPPILRTGDMVPVGKPSSGPAGIDFAPYPDIADKLSLRLIIGPRDDWLAPGEMQRLSSISYRVASASNRIGVRLDGPALAIRFHGQLPSEGLVLGAVQLPSSGQPLIFLADHPTTGGYPVIGVLPDEDVARCAQARPGTPISLSPSR